MKTLTTFLVLLLPCLASAQRMPLDDGSGRIVQVIDVGEFVAPEATTPEATLRRARQETIARFLAEFAAPGGIRPEIQPLGERHLVLLGTAEQAGMVDRLLHTARKQRDETFRVEGCILKLTGDQHRRLLEPLMKASEGDPANPAGHAVLQADQTAKLKQSLTQEGAAFVESPMIVVRAMSPATLSVCKQIAYVRDFEIEVVDGKTIANPVIGVVNDGIELQVTCSRGEDGKISVSSNLEESRVGQPIPRFKTVIGTTKEVEIQLPNVATIRAHQNALLASGNTAVLSAKGPDGGYLVMLLTVTGESAARK